MLTMHNIVPNTSYDNNCAPPRRPCRRISSRIVQSPTSTSHPIISEGLTTTTTATTNNGKEDNPRDSTTSASSLTSYDVSLGYNEEEHAHIVRLDRATRGQSKGSMDTTETHKHSNISSYITNNNDMLPFGSHHTRKSEIFSITEETAENLMNSTNFEFVPVPDLEEQDEEEQQKDDDYDNHHTTSRVFGRLSLVHHGTNHTYSSRMSDITFTSSGFDDESSFHCDFEGDDGDDDYPLVPTMKSTTRTETINTDDAILKKPERRISYSSSSSGGPPSGPLTTTRRRRFMNYPRTTAATTTNTNDVCCQVPRRRISEHQSMIQLNPSFDEKGEGVEDVEEEAVGTRPATTRKRTKGRSMGMFRPELKTSSSDQMCPKMPQRRGSVRRTKSNDDTMLHMPQRQTSEHSSRSYLSSSLSSKNS